MRLNKIETYFLILLFNYLFPRHTNLHISHNHLTLKFWPFLSKYVASIVSLFAVNPSITLPRLHISWAYLVSAVMGIWKLVKDGHIRQHGFARVPRSSVGGGGGGGGEPCDDAKSQISEGQILIEDAWEIFSVVWGGWEGGGWRVNIRREYCRRPKALYWRKLVMTWSFSNHFKARKSEMEFLDINLTKDSSVLFHAIHIPFTVGF
jgi:hypothetical protein